MTRHCSAGGCKSRDNRETREAGITFHRLPRRGPRRNLWIINSHREGSWDPQTNFVYFCSKHFTPESFELIGYSGIRRLKDDAFPTVFESFSTKRKRTRTVRKKEHTPARKKSCSGDEESARVTDQSQRSEEPTDDRSVAAAEETNDNIPASSQELSEVVQTSQQECTASPPPVSRPLSPSHYMRRLPPPPGFYLSKEHSYAQLCPLLWRRRYNQAIDCLEKALRQLHAARRRENRLRSTVLRLQDKQLKQALLVSQDGCKNGLTPGAERRRGRGGCNYELTESDAKSEDTGLFEEGGMDQLESGDHFLPDTNSWPEEERAYCFYCGRGQTQDGGQVVSKTGRDAELTENEDSLEIQRSTEARARSTAESAKNTKTAKLKRSVGKSVQTHDTEVTNPAVLLQTQGLQHEIPAGESVADSHEQSLLFLGSHCEGETEAAGQKHQHDVQQQQQLFWIQDITDGQVILVPVPAEDRLQTILRTEGVTDEAQTILVSAVDPQGDIGLMIEDSGGVSTGETACHAEQNEQHFALNTASPVEMREDVREKLKEHLEGFHLQLSTEFLN